MSEVGECSRERKSVTSVKVEQGHMMIRTLNLLERILSATLSRLELVGIFSLSCFISYLRFLFYLGSISILLRGRGAIGWAATTKTGSSPSPRYVFSFSFVYPANNRYRYYDSDRQHLNPTLPRRTATASTIIHSNKSTNKGQETFKSTRLLGHKNR